MTQHRFLPLAEEELGEAAAYYEAAKRGLGDRFLDDVQAVIKALHRNPEIGHRLDAHLRRALLRNFPYALIYALEKEGLLIVAVSHQRRRPGYWARRQKNQPGT